MINQGQEQNQPISTESSIQIGAEISPSKQTNVRGQMLQQSITNAQEQRQTQIKQQQNRATLVVQNQINQNERPEQIFQFILDKMEYKIIVQMIHHPFPEQQIYVNEGTTWYYVENQQLNQDESGRYNPQYQNEQGIVANINLNMINQWVIFVTCISDHYQYTGMLTEQEIIQIHWAQSIAEVFDNFVSVFKNPEQEINKQNGSINLKKNDDGNMSLEYIQKITINQNIKNYIYNWYLIKQKDEQIVEKKINFANKQNSLVIQKLEHIQQQNEQLEQNIKSEFNNKFQNLQIIFYECLQNISAEFKQQINDLGDQFRELKLEIRQLKQQSKQEKQQEQNLSINNDQFLKQDTKLKEQQNTIEASQKLIMERLDTQNSFISKLNDHFFPKQIITKKLKPSELEKNNGQYRTYPLEGAGIFIFELKIKVENKLGLSIGLNQTLEFLNPYYLIDLLSEQQTIGLDSQDVKYEPQVNDQISFKVDLINQIAILTANEEEITFMQFQKQEGTQLYLCVGRFKQNQEITDFME